MFNSIQVFSRDDMIDLSAKISHPCIIVSISGYTTEKPVFAKNKSIKDVLYLNFGDYEFDPCCITKEQAKQIVNFIKKYEDTNYDLYFHCRAGISRSAGCAAAAMLIMYGDDSAIFNNPKYRPNMKCYRRILEASGMDFNFKFDDRIEL